MSGLCPLSVEHQTSHFEAETEAFETQNGNQKVSGLLQVSPQKNLLVIFSRFLLTTALILITEFYCRKRRMKIPKRRGPLPTGKGTLIGVRLQPAALRALDQWIRRTGMEHTRPEAIRHFVNSGLVIDGLTRSLAKDRSPQNAELTGLKINQLLNPDEFLEMKVERLPSER